MFDFDKDEAGSEDRFQERAGVFDRQVENFPKVKHYGWWLLHNCVAHPLMGVLPIKVFFDFHDWTSRKLNVQ
jgi:hypothetical protein